MKTVTTVAELRDELDTARATGRSIGLVPTMGALHDGHLSLIDRSVAENLFTVVTIFVNPTQFRPGEDLDKYPRKLADDTTLAAEHGADLLFAPSPEEVYPNGFATKIAVSGITETLCGDPTRRGREHFDGVTTVVAKLFNMVDPDRAYFGQKDAQQVAVIRRLVRDLDFRVEVIACPIIREADGLALSSRNVYLSPEDRKRALALSAALKAVQRELACGQRDVAALAALALSHLSVTDEVEYFEIVDPETLAPVNTVESQALALIAARVGSTRLIDNLILEPIPARTIGNDAGSSLPSPFPTNPTSNSQGAVI